MCYFGRSSAVLWSASIAPQLGELARPFRVGLVVEIDFGRRDVAVPQHSLYLVDFELADRLRPEGVPQIVEADLRQAGTLARFDEAPIEVSCDDRLSGSRVTLEDQVSPVFPWHSGQSTRRTFALIGTARVRRLSSTIPTCCQFGTRAALVFTTISSDYKTSSTRSDCKPRYLSTRTRFESWTAKSPPRSASITCWTSACTTA